MRKSFVVLVLTLAAVVFAEEGIPFTIKNCGEAIKVTAVAGACSKIATCGQGVALEVVAPKPNKWPAVYFNFNGYYNLDGVGEVSVRVKNLLPGTTQQVGLKVKAETPQGQMPGTAAHIAPGQTRTMRLPLRIESYVFDKDPHLKGLKRHPKVGGGSSYTLAKTYAISVFLSPMSEGGRIAVESVEFVPADGNAQVHVLKADELNPWVDEFGQAKFAEFPAKIHSVDDLKKQYQTEVAELDAKPNAIPDVDEYGGWKGGPQLKATGHFRTEKVNGKWWLVDPAGRLFFAQGLNCGWDLTPTAIQYREEYFENLPPWKGETAQFWTKVKGVAYRNFYSDPKYVPYSAFSFQRYNLWRKYGADYMQRNREMQAKRCRAWGINCLTGASKELRAVAKIPYHCSFGPSSRKIESAKGYWGELLDPFAPEFETNCMKQAEWLRAAKDDPYCVGCSVHNELSWGRSGAQLAKDVLAAPPEQPARIALLALLEKRGKTLETATDDDYRALGRALAAKYYSTVRRAIKSVAPDMLYLGDRNDKRNPETFLAAAEFCDVVTVNIYDFQASVELPSGAVDKPLWVTEFHFGCYDTGYFYASLIPVASQKKRAECYRNYFRSAIDSPNYVGANWFCWRDQPITGVIGESANSSCGVVSVTDVPYRELTQAMTATAGEMYARRYGAADAKKPFERIALVDSYDFATHFDAETKTGNVQIVDHVLLTGADTVLWRNCSGALLRYQTQEEKSWSTEHPLEKLRLPASGSVYGWLRMDKAEPDIFRTAMETCAARGKAKGVHWPFEETHWSSWTLGAWNLDHPQYWSVSRDGMPWYGRGSLVHPEVVAHKLRLLDELLARGADVVYVDLMRNGGWSPAWEYTPATRARWAAKYPNEEPPKDPRDERWLALVSEYQHAYLKTVRARLDREGRKVRLILGIDHVGRIEGEYNWVFRAIDWKKLAAEGVVDAISVMSVDLSAIDVKDPWTSTRRVYDDVKRACGQVLVYYPIMAYNFTGRPGYPEYMKWTKLSDAETVRKLLALARDAGGAGITMEVVDYRNYSPAVCREICRAP